MDVKVFKPTYDEFKNFMQFIEHMERLGAHKDGVCKVIPPVEWSATINSRPRGLIIPAPLKQTRIEVSEGVYLQTCKKSEAMTLKDYKNQAECKEYKWMETSIDVIEEIFWENVCSQTPYYGADVHESYFSDKTKVWNLKKLPCILREAKNIDFEGITTPYLYYGAAYTAFSFHTEDLDLYSVNYQHYGAPKYWYIIPPEESMKFEALVDRVYEDHKGDCEAHIRHKQILISPKILRENNINFKKVVQNTGELIITFPLAYHGGFNSGFNCNEAVNFATPRWLNYGKRANWCSCKQRVLFPIDDLIKVHQSWDTYQKYIKKEDCTPHPEFPSICTPCIPLTKKFVEEYNAKWWKTSEKNPTKKKKMAKWLKTSEKNPAKKKRTKL